MKVFIAYETKYGNGKKCAEHLERTISQIGHDVNISSIREIKPTSIPQADLYIFSSPTHVGNPPGKMKKFLKKMNISGKESKYALLATDLDPKTKTLQKMEELLSQKGMTKVSEGLKIKVTGMKGPLEDGYQQKLEEFVATIIE